MKTTDFVIIVAAGTGSRVGGTVPKQFRILEGRPILMHCLEKFDRSETQPTIVLVLSDSMLDYWKTLCERYNFKIAHWICSGGDTRFQSVRNGLNNIEESGKLKPDSKIAIHDGARPLISTTLIDQLFQCCGSDRPAVIPALQSTSSVRIGSPTESHAMNRDQVWLVQTPQVFNSGPLRAAYLQPERNTFTDDASVLESAGEKLYLHPGDHRNIKITWEDDITVAEQLITKTL